MSMSHSFPELKSKLWEEDSFNFPAQETQVLLPEFRSGKFTETKQANPRSNLNQS